MDISYVFLWAGKDDELTVSRVYMDRQSQKVPREPNSARKYNLILFSIVGGKLDRDARYQFVDFLGNIWISHTCCFGPGGPTNSRSPGHIWTDQGQKVPRRRNSARKYNLIDFSIVGGKMDCDARYQFVGFLAIYNIWISHTCCFGPGRPTN
jgi:hypothetical protein